MKQRARIGRSLVAAGAVATEVAEATLVSRQSLYRRCRSTDRPHIARRPQRPSTPDGDSAHSIDPAEMSVEEALVALAHRHVAYGYRRLHAKLRRAGYKVNRKRAQRLLRLWGYGLRRRRPHPKAQGRPFDIPASNQL